MTGRRVNVEGGRAARIARARGKGRHTFSMALETAWVTEDMAWVVVSATVSTASFSELVTPLAAC